MVAAKGSRVIGRGFVVRVELLQGGMVRRYTRRRPVKVEVDIGSSCEVVK